MADDLRRTRRRRSLAGVVLVADRCCCSGIWLGGHPEDLPGFMRSASSVQPRRRVVVDEAIEADRARLLPADLRSAAVELLDRRAWSRASDDRFSHYLTPSELQEFDQPPHFTGIGVEVGPMHRGLLIARVFNDSPAARAGLKSGELIVAVNGRPLHGALRATGGGR